MTLFTRQKKTWRRRNFFIKKGFQARFIMKFMGVVMTGSAMSGYIMYLFISKDAEDTFYRSHIRLSSTGEMILPTLLKVNMGVLALVLIAVVVITVLISHKVAGPLHRLGKETEKMAEGDLTGNFKLRTNDELKGLATSFEDMNRELKTLFNEIRLQAEDIDNSAGKLFEHYSFVKRNRLGVINNRWAGEKIEELSKGAFALGQKLARFKRA